MARKSVIKTYTSKGTAAPGVLRGGVKPASLGHFDPTTGKVFQHPRIKADPLSGPSVRVTNPRASGPRAATRGRSLGMGAVGQVGRNRDVGAAAE